MKHDLNELLTKLKDTQKQLKQMDFSGQIRTLAQKYQVEVKTILSAADRKRIEQGLKKAGDEFHKLVSMLPNLEEGQAMLQAFLKKNGVTFSDSKVAKKTARKVKTSVVAAKKAVKKTVRSKTTKPRG